MITFEQYSSVIAQGCLTNSKHPSAFVRGVYPPIFDNKEYKDFICGLGTHLLPGFQNNKSLPTEKEYLLAKNLNNFFPFTDKWKFLKTGSEAASASLKIARAYTGKKKVLSDGYHGWADAFVSLTPPAPGVRGEFYIEKLASLDQIDNETSAVIIEPVITDWSNKRKIWLQKLRKITKELGVVLIFDEIITGFRFNKYSVSNHFDVSPDIILLGKALGGGLPLSAVGGSSELMDGNYFVSSTFAGDWMSLESALEFVLVLQDVYSLKELWKDGKDFLSTFNSLYPEKIRIDGYPTRGRFEGDELTIALFFQEMVKIDILFGRSWFYNFPMMKHKEYVLNASKHALNRIKYGFVSLEGQMPNSPFADKVRSK